MIIIGLDWSRFKHDVVVMDAEGKVLKRCTFSHNGEGFEQLGQMIASLEPLPEAVLVGIEKHEGALLHWLKGRGYQVYAVNPKRLLSLREGLLGSRAKDDRRDAFLLAEVIRLERRYHTCQGEEARLTKQLRQVLREREDRVEERTLITQKLRGILDEWCPWISKLCTDLTRSLWQQELLKTFPLEKELQQGDRAAFRAGYRMTKQTVKRLNAIEQHRPMPIPEELEKGIRRQIVFLVRTVEHLNACIHALEDELKNLTKDHPVLNTLDTLPVKGVVCQAGLLSVLVQENAVGPDWQSLSIHVGMSPVTYASGKSKCVKRRRGHDRTIHQILLQFCLNTVFRKDCWASSCYKALRQSGKSHFSALRHVMRKWLRIICSLLKSGEAYEESRLCQPMVLQPA